MITHAKILFQNIRFETKKTQKALKDEKLVFQKNR